MAITESKLKAGTLTLDAEPFACQAINVRLTPAHDTTTQTDDVIETLCGDTTTPTTDVTITTTWNLNVEAIQDFSDPDGFVQFCLDHNQEVVPFTWKPNATAPTFSGDCRVLAVEMGGEVNRRLTTSAELPVVGDLTVTPAA